MEKSQFEFLLRSYLFDVSSLSESRTIMSQIKQIADQLDASNEFETICNLLKGQQTFLIFKTPEELETILTKALENKDFESFQLLVIKALRVGVFDKREDIPEVIVRALETAYDQGFSFSKTTNTLLLKIQEMFMHIRNLLSIIYKLLRKDSSHKLPVDTYQKLFVLVNELYNDIDKLKTEGEGIGLTYISHIEKELEKVQPDFQFIFGALENMYVDPKIDFFDEVKRLHLEALKEIYS